MHGWGSQGEEGGTRRKLPDPQPGDLAPLTEGRGVGGWGGWVTGIKEGTCCDKHRVLQATDQSLNTTLKSTDVLYVG